MILIKHLAQHQDQRKLAETYRSLGHDLGLEPKDENEKEEQRRNSPKETDLATSGNA